jgi:hypothetical protein
MMIRLLEAGLDPQHLQLDLLDYGLLDATEHSVDVVAMVISLLSEPLSSIKYEKMLIEAVDNNRWPVIKYLLTLPLSDPDSPTQELKYSAIKKAWSDAASHNRLAIAEYLRHELPSIMIIPDDYVDIIHRSICSGSRQGLQYGLNRLSVDCHRIYLWSSEDVYSAKRNHQLAMTRYLKSIRFI